MTMIIFMPKHFKKYDKIIYFVKRRRKFKWHGTISFNSLTLKKTTYYSRMMWHVKIEEDMRKE